MPLEIQLRDGAASRSHGRRHRRRRPAERGKSRARTLAQRASMARSAARSARPRPRRSSPESAIRRCRCPTLGRMPAEKVDPHRPRRQALDRRCRGAHLRREGGARRATSRRRPRSRWRLPAGLEGELRAVGRGPRARRLPLHQVPHRRSQAEARARDGHRRPWPASLKPNAKAALALGQQRRRRRQPLARPQQRAAQRHLPRDLRRTRPRGVAKDERPARSRSSTSRRSAAAG